MYEYACPVVSIVYGERWMIYSCVIERFEIPAPHARYNINLQ